MKESAEDTKKLLLVSSRSWSTTNTSDGFLFHETGTRWWRWLAWWNEALDGEAAETRTGVLLALPLALPLGAVAGHPSHGPVQHTRGRRRRLWRRCSVRRDGWRWHMQVVCLSLMVQPPQLVRRSMQQDTSKKHLLVRGGRAPGRAGAA